MFFLQLSPERLDLQSESRLKNRDGIREGEGDGEGEGHWLGISFSLGNGQENPLSTVSQHVCLPLHTCTPAHACSHTHTHTDRHTHTGSLCRTREERRGKEKAESSGSSASNFSLCFLLVSFCLFFLHQCEDCITLISAVISAVPN